MSIRSPFMCALPSSQPEGAEKSRRASVIKWAGLCGLGLCLLVGPGCATSVLVGDPYSSPARNVAYNPYVSSDVAARELRDVLGVAYQLPPEVRAHRRRVVVEETYKEVRTLER